MTEDPPVTELVPEELSNVTVVPVFVIAALDTSVFNPPEELKMETAVPVFVPLELIPAVNDIKDPVLVPAVYPEIVTEDPTETGPPEPLTEAA